jgi:hypothetical protein
MKAKKQEIVEAWDAANAALETFELFQEGHLSLEKLFLRWQKQGDHLASALGLPPPEWLPLPSFSSETPTSDGEKMGV